MRWYQQVSRGFAAAAFTVLSLVGCGGGGGGGGAEPPPPGVLSGVVVDATDDPTLDPAGFIPGAKVTIFNANTNTAVGTRTTNASGQYSVSLTAGTYYIKVAAQGFDPVPSLALEPVPFAIASGKTTVKDVEMSPAANTNTGYITGAVTNGTVGVPGVLVVATRGETAFSALTDANGDYVIYNVPVSAVAGDYSVTGHRAGYSATPVTATVALNAETGNIDIQVAKNAAGQVPVSFNVIAQDGVVKPANMLVALIHPITRETIPGLAQTKAYSNAINFNIGGVADGSYLVRATYANDTIVVDPDAIVKFGEPKVTLSGGVITSDADPVVIKATGAVALTSPTNAMTSIAPVPVVFDALHPITFEWNAYSSTSDYVLEVMDAATGVVVYGGFTKAGDVITKESIVTVGTTETLDTSEITLESGRIYRWRVYASKDDNQASNGWRLISASEDQRGLIRIQ